MSKEIPNPVKIISEAIRTDEYLAEIAGKRPEEMPFEERRQLRALAIGRATVSLALEHTSESGYADTEGQFYNLVSTLYPFLQARESIDTDRLNGTYNRKDHLGDIEKTIDFNTALREIIDHNQKLSPRELLQFINKTFTISYGHADAQFVEQAAQECIIGMQNEVGFEQIVGLIDGLEYRASTKEEEIASGADMFIEFMGKTIPIDIKSRESKAAELNTSNLKFGRIDSYKIWSHCHRADFHDSFRISYQDAQTKASEVESELISALQLPYKRVA